MVSALLDTSIVVDLLRGYPPALMWNRTQRDLGVSRAAWMEILDGVENKPKQHIAVGLLNVYQLVELNTDDLVWASQQLLLYRLSHGIDSFDCMIASVHHRLQIPLYTRNLKHFTPLIGMLAQSPY